MNLFDIVKRNDRCLQIIKGRLDCVVSESVEGPRRQVNMASATEFYLKNAHEYYSLKSFPRSLKWRLNLVKKGPASFFKKKTTLCISAIHGDQKTLLFKHNFTSHLNIEPIFNWPCNIQQFDLLITTTGPLRIDVGENFSPRSKLIKDLVGFGVEIGPGLNPILRPSNHIRVEYIEEKHPNDWINTYRKDSKPVVIPPDILKLYKIADATSLDNLYSDHSLDFIFTNHVFEHLMNPIGTLKLWSKKIKTGGKVIGVIPDCRNSFDLRQNPSVMNEWISQEQQQQWSVTDLQIQKWIRGTTPTAQIEKLKERAYSVHAHYYTPTTFRDLADHLIENGIYSSIFINQTNNNKDFGFMFTK